MIDTIRFKIPVDQKMLEKIRRRSIELAQYDHTQQKSIFRILKSSAEIGSYDRHVNIMLNEDFNLYLEFSIPKFLLGHNLFMVYPEQVQQCLLDVQRKLSAYFGDFPATIFWELERLDLCYAWKLQTHSDALKLISMLQKLEMPKKDKYVYDTSLMFRGKSMSIKFYLKDDEFYAHDFKELKKSHVELAYELLEKSKGILRFEITLRKLAINRLFFHTDRGTIFWSEAWFGRDKITEKLQHYLKQIIKMDCKFITLDQVYHRLLSFYGKTRGLHLYGFYKIYFHEPNGRTKILESMTRGGIWYNLKKLSDAGIGISLEELPLNLDLDIPSEYAVN